jgi:hypothetical protein
VVCDRAGAHTPPHLASSPPPSRLQPLYITRTEGAKKVLRRSGHTQARPGIVATVKVRIPKWLDPWWGEQYEFTTRLGQEEAMAALTQRRGRLRGRKSADGLRITLAWRPWRLTGWCRANAELTTRDHATVATISVRRPQVASIYFTLIAAVLFIGPLLNFLGVQSTRGLADAAGWLVFVVAGPLIYALIEGMNYRQVRYEERDLLRVLSGALAADPVSLTRSASPSADRARP